MKNLIIIFAIIIAVISGAVYFTSGNSEDSAHDADLTVYASFYPLYYFANEIGGESVQVVNITAGGVEPHDYEPTPQDVANISNADVLLINGGGFEPWADRLADELARGGVDVVSATRDIELHEGEDSHGDEYEDEDEHEEEEHEGEGFDPHVWLSPRLAAQQVDVIMESFIARNPQNADEYRTNADSLKNRLDRLDTQYADELTACTLDSFVTSHAAFSYLAEEYGLNQVSISGISPEAEPSAANLAEITEFVRQNNVKFIFFETLVSPRVSETIASEVGAETLVLDPLEGLSENDINEGRNYFTVMEENLSNLKIALECK